MMDINKEFKKKNRFLADSPDFKFVTKRILFLRAYTYFDEWRRRENSKTYKTVQKFDRNKSCYKCEHYIPLYQSNHPQDPVEYDGNNCSFSDSSSCYTRKVTEMEGKLLGTIDYWMESFLWEDLTGEAGIFIANICPLYKDSGKIKKQINNEESYF